MLQKEESLKNVPLNTVLHCTEYPVVKQVPLFITPMEKKKTYGKTKINKVGNESRSS